jgi:hypothetical protein
VKIEGHYNFKKFEADILEKKSLLEKFRKKSGLEILLILFILAVFFFLFLFFKENFLPIF